MMSSSIYTPKTVQETITTLQGLYNPWPDNSIIDVNLEFISLPSRMQKIAKTLSCGLYVPDAHIHSKEINIATTRDKIEALIIEVLSEDYKTSNQPQQNELCSKVIENLNAYIDRWEEISDSYKLTYAKVCHRAFEKFVSAKNEATAERRPSFRGLRRDSSTSACPPHPLEKDPMEENQAAQASSSNFGNSSKEQIEVIDLEIQPHEEAIQHDNGLEANSAEPIQEISPPPQTADEQIEEPLEHVSNRNYSTVDTAQHDASSGDLSQPHQIQPDNVQSDHIDNAYIMSEQAQEEQVEEKQVQEKQVQEKQIQEPSNIPNQAPATIKIEPASSKPIKAKRKYTRIKAEKNPLEESVARRTRTAKGVIPRVAYNGLCKK